MAVEMDIMRVALDERDQRIATLAAEIIIMRQLEAEVLQLRAAKAELLAALHQIVAECNPAFTSATNIARAAIARASEGEP
jgi:hypothetical protein